MTNTSSGSKPSFACSSKGSSVIFTLCALLFRRQVGENLEDVSQRPHVDSRRRSLAVLVKNLEVLLVALLLAGCATTPPAPVVRSAVYSSRAPAASVVVAEKASPDWKLVAEYSSQVFNPQNVAWAKSLIYQAAKTNGAETIVFDVQQRRYGSDRPAVYAPSTVTVNTGRQDSFSQGMANGAAMSQNAWANAAASAPNQVWVITGKAYAKPDLFDSLP